MCCDRHWLPACRVIQSSGHISTASAPAQRSRRPMLTSSLTLLLGTKLGAAEFVASRSSADPIYEFERNYAIAAVSLLLPLDRPRRLAGHVVDHAVDALDLVDDAGRGAAQEGVVEDRKAHV